MRLETVYSHISILSGTEVSHYDCFDAPHAIVWPLDEEPVHTLREEDTQGTPFYALRNPLPSVPWVSSSRNSEMGQSENTSWEPEGTRKKRTGNPALLSTELGRRQ
jgi:beta-glucanase (GH16 family)